MPLNNTQRQQLRLQCRTVVPGFATPTPAQELAALAAWSAAREAALPDGAPTPLQDAYGEGGLVALFEQQVATLLGKPAAVYMPSGVMAQLIAVKLHCEAARLPRFGMPHHSHLALHEQEAAQALMGLHGVPLGSRLKPVAAADLAGMKQAIACALIELPAREIGGQLPTWDELQALKDQAAKAGLALHMDGARLWQCAGYYQRSYAQIAQGFASVYVSMYKDVGGMAGALLAGEEAFIAQARVWQRRMGGNLYQQTAQVASAMMRFDQRLGLMAACHARAKALAQALAAVAGVRVNPAVPQANMMHLHLDAPADALNEARDALAQQEGVWLMGAARPTEVPGWSVVELTVGDHLLGLEDAQVAGWLGRVMAQARGG